LTTDPGDHSATWRSTCSTFCGVAKNCTILQLWGESRLSRRSQWSVGVYSENTHHMDFKNQKPQPLWNGNEPTRELFNTKTNQRMSALNLISIVLFIFRL
jgi:hypothetical protein